MSPAFKNNKHFTFHLDLDGLLVGVPELYGRLASEKSHEDAESVVGEVSKGTALLLAGAEPEPVALMDGLEHNENVGEWAKASTMPRKMSAQNIA